MMQELPSADAAWIMSIYRRLLDLANCETREELQRIIEKPRDYTKHLYLLGVYHCLKEIDSTFSSADVKGPALPKIYVAEGYDTVESEDGRKGFGAYIPDENQIYIAADVAPEILLKTVFHELAHWMQHASGRALDEDEAHGFANQLYNSVDASVTALIARRPRGRWMERSVDEGDAIDQWQSARCSVCGRYHTTPYMYYFTVDNFCPYCGADMREEDGDESRDQTDINRKGE